LGAQLLHPGCENIPEKYFPQGFQNVLQQLEMEIQIGRQAKN
jgi:hypothetical protein